MKEQELKKMRRLRKLQDIFKRSNIWIIGVPERQEEEQEIENLYEKIMKKNFPNLAKDIAFHKAQSPKETGPKEEYTKAHHNQVTQN